MSLLKITFNHLSNQKLLKMQVMLQKAEGTAMKDQEAKHLELESRNKPACLPVHSRHTGLWHDGYFTLKSCLQLKRKKKSFPAKPGTCNFQQSYMPVNSLTPT